MVEADILTPAGIESIRWRNVAKSIEEDVIYVGLPNAGSVGDRSVKGQKHHVTFLRQPAKDQYV
jgi:hypothetical protein